MPLCIGGGLRLGAEISFDYFFLYSLRQGSLSQTQS